MGQGAHVNRRRAPIRALLRGAVLVLAAAAGCTFGAVPFSPGRVGDTVAPDAAPQAPPAATLPAGWPRGLELGMADYPGGATAMQATAPFGLRYQYLAGGANTGAGWATWNAEGRFVDGYIEESREHGLLPVFTYYMMVQSAPGKDRPEAEGVWANVRDLVTMTAYYADLRLCFQRAGAFADTVVVLHLEPDLWGYLQQRADQDDARGLAMPVAATGLAELAALPDTAAGFAQAILRLRDTYAPNVLLAYHLSDWGTRTSLVWSKPSDGRVAALARQAAGFYQSLGASFDLTFAEFSDRDAAFNEYVRGDRGRTWWDDGDFRRHVQFLATYAGLVSHRLVLWQIPYGNTRMRALDNTWNHFQDNRVEWLLDDPTRAHLNAYRQAGVIALLFGRGADGATCACDAARDGVTDPAPINGNTDRSLSADDDGGFFRQKAAEYYAAGALALP